MSDEEQVLGAVTGCGLVVRAPVSGTGDRGCKSLHPDMSKTKKTYLVVGGAGFIGSNLAEKLVENNHRVIVLDNLSGGRKENIPKGARFIKADMRHTHRIAPYFNGANGVFLLAALPRVSYSIKYPARTTDNNIRGTVNVLTAAKEAGVKRVVFSSSSSIYGDGVELPAKESAVPRPMSPYALQKLMGERYCALFSQIYDLETVSLRYFNVYGPKLDLHGAYALVMGVFLRQRARNKPLTITGDGSQTRDFTHVSDVVKANILAMSSRKVGQGEALNIGAGHNISINRLARMFGSQVKYIPARLEPHDTLADNSLARELLGWKPRVQLEDGVRDLVTRFKGL